jgi:hypothetical protein
VSTNPATTNAYPTPVTIDYTGRDFYSLREELITRVKDRVNNGGGNKWYGNDPADFGVALIEAFAYMGDVVAYYIDRVANESTLLTATQRDSLVNLALSYGYIPSSFQSATCTVTLTNNTGAYDLATIPAGAQITGSVAIGDTVQKVTFTTSADVLFSSTASITAISASTSGSTTTITYTANNTAVVNDYVRVTGASSSGFNVTNARVTYADATSFAVQVSGTVTGSTSTASAKFSGSTRTVSAFHGEQIALQDANLASPTISGDIAGEKVGVSDGTSFQVFGLKENQIVDGTVRVFVQYSGSSSSVVYGEWTRVLHLSDYGPTDPVFTTITDAENNVFIQFGDGVSGAIPNLYSAIKAQYVLGGGTIGNIPVGTLSSLSWSKLTPLGVTTLQQTALKNAIQSITNTTLGLGGLDPESDESIRINAPQAFSALNRAVSLADYSGLALQTPTAGKANASADVWTSVNLYVAPRRDVGSTDNYPGKDETNTSLTAEWYSLQSDVQTALASKLPIGTTLTVSPPTYVTVGLSIKYTSDVTYTDAQVEAGIKFAMSQAYSYQTMDFGTVVYPEEIEYLLRGVPGVSNVKVISLYRSGQDVNRTVLLGDANEIFVFLSGNIALQAFKETSTLSALTASAGTLSPTFSSTTLSYQLALPNGTTSVTLTPTVTAGTSATVTVNNTLPATAVTTAVGDTIILVTVTAEDGTTTTTYKVTATRTS